MDLVVCFIGPPLRLIVGTTLPYQSSGQLVSVKPTDFVV